jgi:hypothetical protein
VFRRDRNSLSPFDEDWTISSLQGNVYLQRWAL